MNTGKDILYLLAEFQVAKECFPIKNRLHHPQGKSTQRTYLNARCGFTRTFSFKGRESVQAITIFFRLVNTQHTDAMGIHKIKMGQGIISFQFGEHRPI